MTADTWIADAMRRGMGRAAFSIGVWCDAYRPQGTGSPLDAANRFLRLPAAFKPPPNPTAPLGWVGTLDTAYTRVGDYLIRPESALGAADGGVWFIAAQEPLQWPQCVRASRMVDVMRPGGATQHGTNGYGGVTRTDAAPLLTQWPAGIAVGRSAGAVDADLPADVPAGSWIVLLPSSAGVTLRNGDLVLDDLGRTAVVASAELTSLGWRLLARQATA